jgi:hypothetical protein
MLMLWLLLLLLLILLTLFNTNFLICCIFGNKFVLVRFLHLEPRFCKPRAVFFSGFETFKPTQLHITMLLAVSTQTHWSNDNACASYNFAYISGAEGEGSMAGSSFLQANSSLKPFAVVDVTWYSPSTFPFLIVFPCNLAFYKVCCFNVICQTDWCATQFNHYNYIRCS